ncbi:site-specific integrase [Enterococcus sp. 669A]|uniref:Site-specific integrase n=1 Tax=Candidatus Enterococcus moelleringii TaxID=2815325 RepID=A0ABS3LB02_9ENTE|nr:site-specific integrase [Enterococcus sp. 669A]MBO1305599.1 site-specific integrase [Enterococcus sp. 669A]
MRRGENIYFRKNDKRWEGRVIIGRKSNGKPRYKSVYGKNILEVKLKLYPLKLKYQLLREEHGDSCMSFQDWGIEWLRLVQADIKESTFSNYEHKLSFYALSAIGMYSLNELDEAVGLELLDSLLERELQPSTIQVIFRIVKQCVNRAIEKKLIKVNPFNDIKLPKVMKKTDQALSKKEQKQLEKAALSAEKGYGLPTLLALHAGLRIGEAAALPWENVDFERNTIRVDATYQRVLTAMNDTKTELVYTSSKTASSIREIPMSKTLKNALLEHKKQATGEFVFSNKANPSEPRLLTYHFHQIRKKANLEHVHFHQLRHTFATRCVESRGDIVSVSVLMGHSSPKMTLDRYAGSMMEQRIQVVNQMEEAIG